VKIGLPDFVAKLPKAVKLPSGNGKSLLGSNSGKLMAFVLLAFVIGAGISKGSYAFADDSATNPFRAIWEAIGELQTKTDSLQAQIDEIKEQGVAVSSGEQVEVNMADASLTIDVGNDDFQTIIDVVATNTGDDNAVGVKILTYYQMSILDVTFIDGAQCTDQARGIIECYVGTIESGGEAAVKIYATPSQLDEQAIITADVSSITKDADPANNHAELVFITSEEPVVVEEEEEQPDVSGGGSEEQSSEEGSEETSGEEQPSEEQSSEEQSGEQTGEEGSEETSGEEGSESGGEESSDQGSEDSGGESSSDQGSESGGSEEGGSDSSSSDSGSSDSGSDSGDSSGDSGSDSGDSGSDSGSGDSGSSDGGSSGGDSGGDSGGSDGGSGGDSGGSDGGSSGGDSGGESA
jgi:hypothetical protein